MNFNLTKRNYFLIPMLLSLICVLIITLSNNFPLSWDIYTHINYSLAYLHNGITSVDYLLNAPNGKTIGYPPLFHMVLILTSFVSGTKLIDAARILQVLLSLCNVFTICYVAKEFYDEMLFVVSNYKRIVKNPKTRAWQYTKYLYLFMGISLAMCGAFIAFIIKHQQSLIINSPY